MEEVTSNILVILLLSVDTLLTGKKLDLLLPEELDLSEEDKEQSKKRKIEEEINSEAFIAAISFLKYILSKRIYFYIIKRADNSNEHSYSR